MERIVKHARMEWLRKATLNWSDTIIVVDNWPCQKYLSDMLALDSIHDAGVLHGDVALRNFVCEKRTDKVFIIDFEFSLKKGDREDDWNKLIVEEKNELRKIFKYGWWIGR